MDINEFRRILTSFADEPTDVDIRLGRIVAQIRDDVFDVEISYSETPERLLLVTENEQQYPARSWLFNRVARLPQLADRILAATNVTQDVAEMSPFVTLSGSLSPDLSADLATQDDQAIPDTVQALLRKADNPLPGATSVLYITSDAGEGKTTLINRVAREQAQLYKERKVSSLVVPIPLGGRAFLTFDDAVIASLVNKLRFNYLYFDAFVQLVRMGAIVPAFDGYEEMLVEGSKNEAVSALGSLVQSLDSSGTIFVAARKAFFEYLSFKTQAKLFDAIGNRSASFSRLEIARWDKTRFCRYGQLRKINDSEEIFDTVASRLGSDHPLLTRAVLVRRLFDVAAQQQDRNALAELLGTCPQDYFYTFIDAIVKREASEKWLSRTAHDVLEPLLKIEEHHELLSQIAQEMWQTTATSLRHDVIDVLVEIFSDSHKKAGSVTRQIKERLKQHSLLVADSSKGQALAFDHEDFQSFYTGESLGRLLGECQRTALQTFISINLLSRSMVEQAVQYLLRHKLDSLKTLATLTEINASEGGFSYCKENCGTLAMRIVECIVDRDIPLTLHGMLFSAESLAGRQLHSLIFDSCHFQPTSMANGHYEQLKFKNCEFERLEVDFSEPVLQTCEFIECNVDSMVLPIEDEQSFDPAQIANWLSKAGATVISSSNIDVEPPDAVDERLKLLERFLRVFLRNTQVDEDIIRLRLGNGGAPRFFEEVLPALLEHGLLEEVPWKGRGLQRRYKLRHLMSDINDALEHSNGSFDAFLSKLAK
jgi:hypothetical protein